ncbi:uncharacterized protein [Dermacentor albipictus]|uniref:uncharacterized protein isoform X1 n=1 Tax=Dermacentor albipictus TaxID=60249 RepID=UPI0038FCA80F
METETRASSESGKMSAKKRALWISAVRRANPDGSLWQSTKHARICGAHFITGRPSKLINHPDYVPTAFTYSKTPGEAAVRRHNRCVKRQSDCKLDAGMELSQHGRKSLEALLQLKPTINDDPDTSTHDLDCSTADVRSASQASENALPDDAMGATFNSCTLKPAAPLAWIL